MAIREVLIPNRTSPLDKLMPLANLASQGASLYGAGAKMFGGAGAAGGAATGGASAGGAGAAGGAATGGAATGGSAAGGASALSTAGPMLPWLGYGVGMAAMNYNDYKNDEAKWNQDEANRIAYEEKLKASDPEGYRVYQNQRQSGQDYLASHNPGSVDLNDGTQGLSLTSSGDSRQDAIDRRINFRQNGNNELRDAMAALQMTNLPPEDRRRIATKLTMAQKKLG